MTVSVWHQPIWGREPIRLAIWLDHLTDSKGVDPSTGRKHDSMEAHLNQNSINVHFLTIPLTGSVLWIQERPLLKCYGSWRGRLSLKDLAFRIFFYHLWSLIWTKSHCKETLILNLINCSLGKNSQQAMKDTDSDCGGPISTPPATLWTLCHYSAMIL